MAFSPSLACSPPRVLCVIVPGTASNSIAPLTSFSFSMLTTLSAVAFLVVRWHLMGTLKLVNILAVPLVSPGAATIAST